jgi:hypothetical protein
VTSSSAVSTFSLSILAIQQALRARADTCIIAGDEVTLAHALAVQRQEQKKQRKRRLQRLRKKDEFDDLSDEDQGEDTAYVHDHLHMYIRTPPCAFLTLRTGTSAHVHASFEHSSSAMFNKTPQSSLSTPLQSHALGQSPAYAQTAVLADTLRVLFRPVHIGAPDMRTIFEVKLTANGFIHAKSVARRYVIEACLGACTCMDTCKIESPGARWPDDKLLLVNKQFRKLPFCWCLDTETLARQQDL